VPWFLSELKVPVWGTEFTLAYVKTTDEHNAGDADLREMRLESFKIGRSRHASSEHSLSIALPWRSTAAWRGADTGDSSRSTPTDNRLSICMHCGVRKRRRAGSATRLDERRA